MKHPRWDKTLFKYLFLISRLSAIRRNAACGFRVTDDSFCRLPSMITRKRVVATFVHGVAITAGLVLGLASPATAIESPSGLYSQLQFCSTDVLDLGALDCRSASRSPSEYPTAQAVRDDAARSGMQAKWCSLSVAGQAALCRDV